MAPIHRRSFAKGLTVGWILLLVGCGPGSVSHRLEGRWVGQPDTFAAQRQRSPIPTAKGYQPTQDQGGADGDTVARIEALQPQQETDLEAFDFQIALDFHADGQVEMLLNGGRPMRGHWEVLSTDVGISRLEIAVPQAPGAGKPTQTVKRRYSLKMNTKGDAFTLREEGVDPRFGWLYFTRAESAE